MYFSCLYLLGQYVRCYSTHRLGKFHSNNYVLVKDEQGVTDSFLLLEQSFSSSM